MDEEYRLSALRVQRNVLRAELSEDEADDDDQLQEVERRIEELAADPSETASIR